MLRLLLVLTLSLAASVQAAQAIDPAVFMALERAQTAQSKGDYAAARKALDGASAKPGSNEEALLWRSRGYLAWAEGNNRQALEWLDKAVASGKLDEQLLAGERLNLARLNLVEGRYAKVVSLLGSANHDEAVYPDHPEKLDIQRPNVKPLSFGGGIHFCLGAQLARIEAEIAISTLLRRIPDLRLDDAENPEWRPTFVLRGLKRLPASW